MGSWLTDVLGKVLNNFCFFSMELFNLRLLIAYFELQLPKIIIFLIAFLLQNA